MRALGGGVISDAPPRVSSRRGRRTAWGLSQDADAGLEAVLAHAHLQDSRPTSRLQTRDAPETPRRPPSEALERLARPKPDPLDGPRGVELNVEDFPFSPKIGTPWCLDVEEQIVQHQPAPTAQAEKWRATGKKRSGFLGKCCINATMQAATEGEDSVSICKHCRSSICTTCWAVPCKYRQERWKNLSPYERAAEMEETGLLSGWESSALAQRGGGPVHDRLNAKAKVHGRTPSSRSCYSTNFGGTGTSWGTATSLGIGWGTEGHKSDLSPVMFSEKAFKRLTSPRCQEQPPDPSYLPCMKKQLPCIEDFEWNMVCHEPSGRSGPGAPPTRCSACKSSVSADGWSKPCRTRSKAWKGMDLAEKVGELERLEKVSSWQAKAMLRCAQPVFSRLCGDAFDPSSISA